MSAPRASAAAAAAALATGWLAPLGALAADHGSCAAPYDSAPSLIIAGIGDSGTRGVQGLMETLGVRFCSVFIGNGKTKDNLYTAKVLSNFIKPLLLTQHLGPRAEWFRTRRPAMTGHRSAFPPEARLRGQGPGGSRSRYGAKTRAPKTGDGIAARGSPARSKGIARRRDRLAWLRGAQPGGPGLRPGGLFAQAAEAMSRAASRTLRCICNESGHLGADAGAGAGPTLTWGYKNPKQAYLLPVIEKVFRGRTRVLLVARDPRDICTGRNQGQYNEMAQYLYRPGDARDCWTFWARVWQKVLGESHAAVVRIEDLVVPAPQPESESLAALRCALRLTGLPLNVSTAQMLGGLEVMHNFTSVYMGGSEKVKYRRSEVEQQLRLHTQRSLIHPVMRDLGYNPKGYGLLKPERPDVCR